MFDYHVHPDYSIDAEGTIEEYCQVALQRGLTEIAFTTHFDTDTTTDDCHVVVQGERLDSLSGDWLEDYEQSIRTAGDVYKDRGLKVLLGVEVDYIPNVQEILPDKFFDTNFDIILGSTHLVDHIAISAEGRAEEVFMKYSMKEIGEKYYTLLLEATDSGLFDIMSHLDLYRRFGRLYYGGDISDIWRDYLQELAKSMKRNNVGFEINTSPLRRGQTEPMPSRRIIRALKEAGVLSVTVGSDAHSPVDVGAGISYAMKLLNEIGFVGITTFDHRKQTLYRL